MNKLKTSEMTGAALDWAVAKCEGVNEEAFNLYYTPTEPSDLDTDGYPEFHYSTIWAQGGPIIEREQIDISFNSSSNAPFWAAYSRLPKTKSDPWPIAWGQTPLIAAMRCYVAIKLGDWVDMPEELS